jgi:hypothetical protein
MTSLKSLDEEDEDAVGSSEVVGASSVAEDTAAGAEKAAEVVVASKVAEDVAALSAETTMAVVSAEVEEYAAAVAENVVVSSSEVVRASDEPLDTPPPLPKDPPPFDMEDMTNNNLGNHPAHHT